MWETEKEKKERSPVKIDGFDFTGRHHDYSIVDLNLRFMNKKRNQLRSAAEMG